MQLATGQNDPQKTQAIAVLIAKLGAHYYRPDFGPQQVKHMALDFIEDLEEFTIAQIDEAIRRYRRDPKTKFFPTPGQLRVHAIEARKEQREADDAKSRGPVKHEFGDSRQFYWWLTPRKFWKPHWSESEIPADDWDYYEIHKAKRSGAAA